MKWLLLCAAVLLGAGCGGYSFNSRTAKDIKSINVPFFENRTPEPSLEISVTESIINNLISDNTLKVVDEPQADAVLQGVIVNFENAPFSFNTALNAEEYHVVVTVQATLYNRRTNETIWDNSIRGDGSYFLEGGDNGFTYEDALDEALREITERILNLTVQDW